MRVLVSFLLSLLSLCAAAEVRLPMVFADGMVLQQLSAVRLWGWCDRFHDGTAGREVTVTTSWDNRTYTAVSDRDGRFEVTVQTPQAGGPYVVTFFDHSPLTIDHSAARADNLQSSVLNLQCYIGEVWVCSGQSNMEMTLKGYKGQPVEEAAETLLSCGDSLLRLFTVGHATALTPQRDVSGHWQAACAASVREFSATAYFFGRALRRVLGVPVGLVCTAYGGSACEAWMHGDWLRPFCAPYRSPKAGTTVVLPTSDDDVKRLKQRCPTALYNGQLAPLVGYGIRGAIWYQGEDNVPRYDYYAELLKAMVQGWRKAWGQGDFPFYYCQIAPYDYSLIKWKDSQLLREQQMKAEAMIPNARMVVLMDAGLEYGIHPRKKRLAGERLALLALSHTYQVKGLPDFATYSSVEFHGDTAIVAFDRSREWVYFEHGPRSRSFEVASTDGIYHPADAWTSRNRVYVHCDSVKKPVAVRYAWRDWIVGDLMHDGLPVSSFRTDSINGH